MKINWGTGIVIAFALFMSFILFFVFKVQSDSKYDNELVVEKYYLKEQTFEKQMEKEQNAHDMSEAVKIANKMAEKGDTVLLSPACASFDLFENYEDRGRKFKQAVQNL